MLYLAEMIKQEEQTQSLILDQRLPDFLAPPLQVNVTYSVEKKEDFYLISLRVAGNLTTICQRCMEEFSLFYENATLLAVAANEERAGELLEYYECIVSPKGQLDLNELIIDELHLYAPQFHPEIKDCNEEINQFITGSIEA